MSVLPFCFLRKAATKFLTFFKCHNIHGFYEKIDKQDKKKHLSYEVTWQIWDMYEVPNVTFASKEQLEDPEWKPSFEAGVVITNFAFNGDEPVRDALTISIKNDKQLVLPVCSNQNIIVLK